MKWVVLLFASALLCAPAWAQGGTEAHAEEQPEVAAERRDFEFGLVAVGAGLAVGLAGLGTGLAQSRIGAAGIGALAENQKLSGLVFLLVALPETIVLFGFVVAFLLYQLIPGA